MAPVEALDVGAEVAGMEVLHLLGEGAFGRVYAVQAPQHSEPLALKIMSIESADENTRRRFQREAEVIRRLESEYVPAIYDVGTFEEGSPYILMELLKGQTLGEILDEGRLPWRRAISLGVQACSALEIAHAAGVLHRDIKPDNLFITGEGDDEQLKILDFGVATFVSGQTDYHGALTQTSAIVGTPHYMSPEQIRSTNIDVQADIYMLGVVLYECLTGSRPFSGENLGHLLGNVLSGTYRPIAHFAPRTPRVITNAVQRAMSLEPEHRFSSAKSFGRALAQARSAMSELPPKATVSPGDNSEKPTLAAADIKPPAPAPSPSPSPASPLPAEPALPVSGTQRRGLLVAGALALLSATAGATYLFTKKDPPTSPPAPTAPAAEPTPPTSPPDEEEEEATAPTDPPDPASTEPPPEAPPEAQGANEEAREETPPPTRRRRRRPEPAEETAVVTMESEETPPQPDPPETEPVLPPDGLINPFD